MVEGKNMVIKIDGQAVTLDKEPAFDLGVLRDNRRAILVDRIVVPEPDFIKWARWFDAANRRVAFTMINRRRRIRVSTVFLGLDHGWRESEWFETMVFGTSINEECVRYADWESAVKGHARMVARARQARQTRPDNYARGRRGARKLFQKSPAQKRRANKLGNFRKMAQDGGASC